MQGTNGSPATPPFQNCRTGKQYILLIMPPKLCQEGGKRGNLGSPLSFKKMFS